MSSFSCLTMLMIFSGEPHFDSILQRAWLFTVSKALGRSMNKMSRSRFCSLHFSWMCRPVVIMSIVPRFALNPHCDCGRTESTMCSRSLLSISLARILPAIDSKEMPRWLPQSLLSPFYLEIVTIEASLWSCELA